MTGWSSYAVEPARPYDFTTHLRAFTIPGRPLPWLFDSEVGLLRVLAPVGDGVPLEAVFEGEPWRPRIRVRVYGGGGEVVEWFREHVRADFNYADFLEKARLLPALYRLALKYPGVRPGRCLSLYNALLDVIVKQRITLRVALRLMSRIIEHYGSRKIVGGTAYYWYPPPRSIIAAGVEGLRSLPLPRMKARALVEVALAEEEGRLPSVREAIQDPWSVARELENLYGVGPWTSRLAVALVHPLFPLGPSSDLAVRRGMSLLLGREPGASEVDEVLRVLGDYAGLAMYLVALDYEAGKG